MLFLYEYLGDVLSTQWLCMRILGDVYCVYKGDVLSALGRYLVLVDVWLHVEDIWVYLGDVHKQETYLTSLCLFVFLFQ